jgi:predicted acetyltransferase
MSLKTNINDLHLVPLSLKQKDMYEEYNYYNPDNLLRQAFQLVASGEFEDLIGSYNIIKECSIAEACKRKNKLSFEPIPRAMKIYCLINQDKLFGMASIQCEFSELEQKYRPFAGGEISVQERGKGYGKRLLSLLLKENDVDIEFIYLQVISTNLPSLSVVRSIPNEFLGISYFYGNEEIQNFRVPNLAYQYKSKERE